MRMKMENGVLTPLTAEENAVRDQDEAEIALAKQNESVLLQIKALEAMVTPRRMREAFTDSTWIENIEAQIVALRTQLR